MSKIEQLIQQLCPQGVEYKRLGEVLSYEQPSKYIVKSTDYEENGTPVLTAGQTFILGYTSEREGIYSASENNPVIIFDDFTTSFHWVTFDFKVKSSAMKMLKPISSDVSFRYLYYAMKCIRYETSEHARQWIAKYSQIEIPLPPLPVQQEIVRILDAFTELEAQLEAELEARKKQYAYYRDTLLSFEHDDPKVEWKRLGEVGTFTRGNGLQKKDFTETGVGCVHYGQIYTRYGTATDKTISYCSPELAKRLKKARKGDLIIATTSENVEDVCKAVVWLGDEEIVTGGHACVYSHNQDPKYIAYFFQTENFFRQKKKYASGVKVIDIKGSDLEKVLIPLPPLEEQRRITSILDKFEALTSDLQSGLPAEIEARRKQYEYYRDQLLSFKVKN